MIFRSLFAVDGLVNLILIKLGFLEVGYNFLAHPNSARMVIILALIWRWTGYNMVFYLATDCCARSGIPFCCIITVEKRITVVVTSQYNIIGEMQENIAVTKFLKRFIFPSGGSSIFSRSATFSAR